MSYRPRHYWVLLVHGSARWSKSLTTLGLGIALLSLPLAVWADEKAPLAAGLFNYPQGGPARTGAYPTLHLPDRPVTVSVDVIRGGVGTPIISGDQILVSSGIGDLMALSLKDGAVVWSVSEPGWDRTINPVVVGDRIYCLSNRGLTVHALADGSVVWRKEITGGLTGSSPLVIGGLVIAGGPDGFLYALDAVSGDERWKADIVTGAPDDPAGFDGAKARSGNIAARPCTAVSDGTTVFLSIFDQSRVVAFKLRTGEPRWSFQAKGWIAGAPTVAEGKVFVGSQDHKVYALDSDTGEILWEFATKWRVDGDLGYCEGSVFVCASDGRCYRLDAKTGDKVWEYETEVGPDKKHFFLSGTSLIDATAVYFGSSDGYLYALNRKDGTLKWRHKSHVNGERVGSPITDGTRLYVSLRPLFDFQKQRDKEGVHGIVTIEQAKE